MYKVVRRVIHGVCRLFKYIYILYNNYLNIYIWFHSDQVINMHFMSDKCFCYVWDFFFQITVLCVENFSLMYYNILLKPCSFCYIFNFNSDLFNPMANTFFFIYYYFFNFYFSSLPKS